MRPSPEEKIAFGKWLKAAREGRSWSQGDLVDALGGIGINQSRISRWENGGQVPHA